MTLRLLAVGLIALAATGADPPRTDLHGDPLPDGALARFGSARDRLGECTLLADRNWDLSPDGKTLALETAGGLILFDVDRGLVFRRIRLPDYFVSEGPPSSSVRFSQDGKWVVRVARGSVRVLDVATGRTQCNIPLLYGPSVTFLPGTSRFIILEHEGKGAAAYDVTTGREVSRIETKEHVAAISPAGKYLIGNDLNDVYLLDAKTAKVWQRFPQDASTRSLAFAMTPDDKHLCVFRADGWFRVYDAATGQKLQEQWVPRSDEEARLAVRVIVSPDGGVAYLPGSAGAVRRWDLKAGRPLNPLSGVPGDAFIPHPDGKRLIALHDHGVVRRYDLATRRALPLPAGFEDRVTAWPSPNGRSVAALSGDDERERVDVFDATGRIRWSLAGEMKLASLAWTPDSKQVVCVSPKKITFRDAVTGKPVEHLELPAGNDAAAAFFPNDPRMIVAIEDLGLAVVDLRTGRQTVRANLFDRVWFDMAPDGRVIVSGLKDRALGVYDPTAGRWLVGPVELDETDVPDIPNRALFSPDGTFILGWGHEGGCVFVLDPDTLRTVCAFRIPQAGDQLCYAVSPNGLWMAIGTGEGLLYLRDVQSGRPLGRWDGHLSGITSVAFAGVGRVLTSSSDHTALLWDLRPNQKPLLPPWDALTGDSPTEAFEAIWALAADPQCVDLLRSKILTVKPVAADRVKRLVADLAADRFATRESASRDLQSLGRLAGAELKAGRREVKSEEVRHRLDSLLARIPSGRTREELIQVRAVTVLELAGTAESKELLAEWAVGAPGARLTEDARAALERLAIGR